MKKPVTVGLILLCISFMIITVGYSAMNTTLTISGDAAFRVVADVRFTSFEFIEKSSGASEIYNAQYSKDSFKFGISLAGPDDYMSYKITVQNIGNTDVQLKNVIEENFDTDNFYYILTDTYIGAILPFGTDNTQTFYVTIKRQEDGTINNLEAGLKFEYEAYGLDDRYETDGLTLFAAGTDAPVNGEWIDQSGNGNITLNNVNYDENELGYYFSGDNSCGLTNRSVLPTDGGDFTIETLIKFEDMKSTDESIIAQKTMDGTREAGRFKPFNLFKDESIDVNYHIRSFIINATGDDDFSYYYVTAPSPNHYYQLTLVREGDDFRLYVNSALVATGKNAKDTIKVSSGTTQIGCYNGVGQQNYKGFIYFVRAYNKALTQDQILANYKLDTSTYTQDIGTLLRDYAITVFSATTGDGLYHLTDYGEDRYVFRGASNLMNNYINLGNELWRIVSFESDNTAKIVRVRADKGIPFDESGYRSLANNPYCNSVESVVSGSTEFYGCNAFSANSNFTTNANSGAVNDNSSILDYLNTTVYDSFNAIEKAFLVKHDFDVGPVDYADEDTQKIIAGSTSVLWNGYVGLLSARDYHYGNWKDTASATLTIYNWMGNMVAPNGVGWLTNASARASNTYDAMVINTKGDGTSYLSVRRASRKLQPTLTVNVEYYTNPAIYINTSNLKVNGTGSEKDPFVINYGR